MSDVVAVWQEVLPEVRNGVTGVGVWTALNLSKPIVLDEGNFVLGLPNESSDLSGHLKMNQTKLLIERLMGQKLGQQIQLRVVDGVDINDWETQKRRDAEAQKLQMRQLERYRSETKTETNWASVYEDLTRKNASIQNKSLPQNRAKFYIEAIELVAEALRQRPISNDEEERSFARVLERVSQYSDVPSVLVAQAVLEKAVEA